MSLIKPGGMAMNPAKVCLDRMSTLPADNRPTFYRGATGGDRERERVARMTRGQLNRVSRRTARWASAVAYMTSAQSIGGVP